MLYSSWNGIVLQEVPGELSLAISISGCPLRCKGCHSAETRNPTYGTPFNLNSLTDLIKQHKHITCVVFYGGEWKPLELIELLQACKQHNLLTCLYTGFELESIPKLLLEHLTYIKVGPYIEELGGIDSPTTNQQFLTVADLNL